jgi:hypothetical protein
VGHSSCQAQGQTQWESSYLNRGLGPTLLVFNFLEVLGIFEMGSYYLYPLALNCNPPDLCLCCSKDYRCEPQSPGPFKYLIALIGGKVNMMSRAFKVKAVSAV